MTPLLTLLTEILKEAAVVVREVYDQDFEVEYKAPGDPVTRADKLANQLICERLGSAFVGVPIVAEESPHSSFAQFRSSPRVFFVDPLDGTHEFVRRRGEFCMMIGYLDGDRAVAGAIHAPLQRKTWCGHVGAGAFTIEENGATSPIAVSASSDLPNSAIVVSRSQRNAHVSAVLEALGAARIQRLGSAGLKAAAVASGQVDAYVAPQRAGMRWDACAADAVVTAAGGTFSDASGRHLDYRAASLANDRGVIASNDALHTRILAVVHDVGTETPVED